MLHKLRILLSSLQGELIKFVYRVGFMRPVCGINKTEIRPRKVVVSLTSYGRRVGSVLYCSLCSLLRQSYKPDVLVLWLNRNLWNPQNLPKKIARLQQKGVTICFCEDLSSYKKLVPALEAYPDAVIITADDDIFYKRNMVEELVQAYNRQPDRIYAHRAHRVGFDAQGGLLPYNAWKEEISDTTGKTVFPTGVGGVLYQKHLLHPDVCRKELFMKLAPFADDVWFYFMGILNNTPITALPGRGKPYYPLDVFYQHFHQGSNLTDINCDRQQNDTQIDAVMRHYGISPSDLGQAN